jgi:dTMP kinase
MFITFEGGEGSGKTTAIRTVAYELKSNDVPVHRYAEPGSTPIGHKVREILLHRPLVEQEAMTPLAELMLFCASRAQFTETVLAPLLKREPSSIVLCDRYVDSTFAYQFYGRNLPWKTVHDLADASTNGIKSDLTLFFDIPPEAALERLSDERRNRLDAEDLDFHNRVYRGYHWLMKLDTRKKWRVVDATQSPEQVAAQAMEIIVQAYGERLKMDKEQDHD